MGGTPPPGCSHAEALAQQTSVYQNQLAETAAKAKFGTGPGIPEPQFGSAKEFTAQHAADFPTVQSLLDAMVKESQCKVRRR